MKDLKVNLDVNTNALKEAINLLAVLTNDVFEKLNTKKENAFKISDEHKSKFRKDVETLFNDAGLKYNDLIKEGIKSRTRYDDIKNTIENYSGDPQLLNTFKSDIFEKIAGEIYKKQSNEHQKSIYFDIMDDLSLAESSGLLSDIDSKINSMLKKRMFAKDFEDIKKINEEIQSLQSNKEKLENNFTSLDELELLNKKYATEKKLNYLKGDNSRLYAEELLRELTSLKDVVKTQEEQVKYLELEKKLKADLSLFREGQNLFSPLKEEIKEAKREMNDTAWYDVQKAALDTISDNIDELLTKSWERSFGEANSFLEQFLLNISKALANIAAESMAKGIFNSITTGSNSGNENIFSGLLSILSGFLPFLGSGGIVNKPTLSVIGEKGPEAVIPLDKISQGGSMESLLEKYLQKVDNWQRDLTFKQRGEDLLAASEYAGRINERYNY